MDDRPPPKPSLEVGALSPDGSRIWTGRFWAVNPAHTPPLDDYTPSFERHERRRDPPYEQRGYGCGGVIAAVVLGSGLTNIGIHLALPIPAPSSLEQGATIALLGLFFYLFLIWGSMVLCLSVGRQGIDVLLLRSMLVGAVFNATFLGPLPLYLAPGAAGYTVIAKLALAGALTTGPALAVLALLLNLLWYRSIRDLRPQLPIFNRARRQA